MVDGKHHHIDYSCRLISLQPPMSDRRQRLVNMAFVKLDRTGDGRITVEDLKGNVVVSSLKI